VVWKQKDTERERDRELHKQRERLADTMAKMRDAKRKENKTEIFKRKGRYKETETKRAHR
jgi:hypothetical protein